MASESLIPCPKCQAVSGDDWSQCDGSCPMEMSPHYDPDALSFPKALEIVLQLTGGGDWAARTKATVGQCVNAIKIVGRFHAEITNTDFEEENDDIPF